MLSPTGVTTISTPLEPFAAADTSGQPDRTSASGHVSGWVRQATWSLTQTTLATSSAETELYSLGSGACEALGARESLGDLNVECTAVLGSRDGTTSRSTAHSAMDRRRIFFPRSRWERTRTWRTCPRNMLCILYTHHWVRGLDCKMPRKLHRSCTSTRAQPQAPTTWAN